MVEYLSLLMFLAVCLLLMFGYPVAFTLAGTALAFAAGNQAWTGMSPALTPMPPTTRAKSTTTVAGEARPAR